MPIVLLVIPMRIGAAGLARAAALLGRGVAVGTRGVGRGLTRGFGGARAAARSPGVRSIAGRARRGARSARSAIAALNPIDDIVSIATRPFTRRHDFFTDDFVARAARTGDRLRYDPSVSEAFESVDDELVRSLFDDEERATIEKNLPIVREEIRLGLARAGTRIRQVRAFRTNRTAVRRIIEQEIRAAGERAQDRIAGVRQEAFA